MSKLLTQNALWLLSAIILASVFLVSSGFFSIDEAIYYLGARAVAEHGSFAIDNGYAQFHAESLKLRFLVDGPHGLTPQYPAGSALLGGLLLPLLGARAFILMNALAGIAILFTIRRICIDQFKSEAIASIAIVLLVAGSFWLEFAVGIWPHMVAAYFALQALWLVIRHLDSAGQDYRMAMLSGLFAGVGILFRLDAAFVIPAIGLILLMFAPRYIRSSVWFGLGVLPSIALMSAFNLAKFGTPNPFSYGQSGGNTDIASYGAAFAALCVVLGLILLSRNAGSKVNRKMAIASVAGASAIFLLVPVTREPLLQLWRGFVALFVDLRTVADHRPGIEPGPGKTVLFVGLAKKALGQSMPWIGLLAILLTGEIQPVLRRIIAALVIFAAVLTMPFIWFSWHGGGGSNMRYFLPVLPVLCILCATIFHDLWKSVPSGLKFAAAGIWLALAADFAWTRFQPSGQVGVQQILSSYVLLATVLTAAIGGLYRRSGHFTKGLTIALFAGGFVLSASFAISDFAATARWRETSASANAVVAGLPPKSLVFAHPEWLAAALPGNGSIAAVRDPLTERVDQDLIDKALKARYRVYTISNDFDSSRDVPPGVAYVVTSAVYPSGRMIELRRVVGHEQHSGPIPPPSAELFNP